MVIVSLASLVALFFSSMFCLEALFKEDVEMQGDVQLHSACVCGVFTCSRLITLTNPSTKWVGVVCKIRQISETSGGEPTEFL